jgi:hypothetical protein
MVDKSSKINATNFAKQDIELEFDEYITLKNAVKEIHVSPPLTYRLQTKVRGKKLTLSFHEKEELREDVTYIISLGESIVDFRANNKLENFRYVFSTGDVIDSLMIKGIAINAMTGDPIENAIISLYNDDRDSSIIVDKPYYLTRTDKKGKFHLQNLKHDTFRIYALLDENNNYVYNQSTDGIGFLTENIVLDSNLANIELIISEPEQELRLINSFNKYSNKIDLVFSFPLDEAPTFRLSDTIQTWTKLNKDTLTIYHKSKLDSFDIYVGDSDTIQVFKKEEQPKTNFKLKNPTASNAFIMGDTLIYSGNTPILNLLKQDSIIISDTSNVALAYDISLDTMLGVINLTPNLSPGKYNIFIPPGTFEDIYGNTNDTIKHKLTCLFEDELSTIKMVINGLDSNEQYLIKLSNKAQSLYSETVTMMDSVVIEIFNYVPLPYEVNIIHDVNENGKLDGPVIWGRIPAEKSLLKSFEKPKANWVVEEEINWTKDKKEADKKKTSPIPELNRGFKKDKK